MPMKPWSLCEMYSLGNDGKKFSDIATQRNLQKTVDKDWYERSILKTLDQYLKIVSEEGSSKYQDAKYKTGYER